MVIIWSSDAMTDQYHPPEPPKSHKVLKKAPEFGIRIIRFSLCLHIFIPQYMSNLQFLKVTYLDTACYVSEPRVVGFFHWYCWRLGKYDGVERGIHPARTYVMDFGVWPLSDSEFFREEDE
jgi:hypothetical protein